MVMGRMADGAEDFAVQRHRRDLAGPAPGGFGRLPFGQCAIAREGELATGRAFLPLEHDAADRLGKGRMTEAIEHDLRDGLLALGIVARLIEHARRQTV